MSTAIGRRLSPDQRRAQLVDIGVRLVSKSSFDAVPIDRVAEEAGISRSLLFHYFPTKRDFQVAVAEAGADELLAATQPDPTLPPEEQLRASLEAFVAYVSERGEAFTSLIRGASGGDPALQAVFDRAHGVVATRILEGLGVGEESETTLLRIAVRGWVALLEEAVVIWLGTVHGSSQDELVAILEASLLAAVTAADIDGTLTQALSD